MTRYALWQQLVTYPAAVDRLVPEAVWPMPGRLIGMAVTVGAGRVVNIAAGKFVVPLGGGNGSALCVSDAVETATFAAAPGAGANRIDLLIVQVHDSAIDSGGANGFTFDVLQGTPAASPAPPAVPARAGVLAQVTSIGGQANLAQSNIALASERTVAGNLVGNFGLAAPNVPYAFLSTPVLAAGTWDLFAQAYIGLAANAEGTVNMWLSGTGAPQFLGPAAAQEIHVATPSGTAPGSSLVIATRVVLAAPTAIAINGQVSAAAGATVYAAIGPGLLPGTGYVARAV